MEQQLLTIEQVAEQVKVPIGTVRYWRYVGNGPACIKVGRYLRYRQTDVDAWLEANTTPAA